MANYFTYFSLVLPLPDEAAQKYALNLAQQGSSMQRAGEALADFPLALVAEDWQFDTEAQNSSGEWGLWLHSENGGVDAVCAFIQHLLQRFNRSGRVTFEWSNDCSKPRMDAYGGGAVIVTARRIKSMSTSQWLQENAA